MNYFRLLEVSGVGHFDLSLEYSFICIIVYLLYFFIALVALAISEVVPPTYMYHTGDIGNNSSKSGQKVQYMGGFYFKKLSHILKTS